jgi:ATP-dependent Lhr-like helicase
LTRLPLASVEEGLGALVAQGRVTCDSFGGLRWLLLPAWRRKSAGVSSGRWNLLGTADPQEPGAAVGAARRVAPSADAEFVARRLLRRTGVVFRRTATRERIPVPWRDVARACRTLEARGEVRGGRFVSGFDGEQYALPEAVTLLRSVRRKPERPLCSSALQVKAADPLNFLGILTPEERVSAASDLAIRVG